MELTLPLSACVGQRTVLGGGKAAGLGALLEHGFPVPAGFVVTTDAYRAAVAEHLGELGDLLAGAGRRAADAEVAARAEALITSLEVPEPVAEAIKGAYAELGEDVLVAVRSSATAEDMADASFAGQQETYLGIRGADAVVDAVRRCWASLFTPQAIGYRARMGVPADGLAMAVVVQEMIAAEAAGVALTLDPASGDRSTIYVEAVLGLGEGAVRGDVPADRAWVEKVTLEPTRTEVATKDRAYRLDQRRGVALREVAAEAQDVPALADAELRELARLVRDVEERFGRAMDVEWAVAPDGDGGRRIVLLQARPETAWSNRAPVVPLGETADWDPLHDESPPELHWTTTNLGETAPGVLSPLGWTLWRHAGERAIRAAGHAIGVLSSAERRPPARDEDRYVKAFFGRAALQVEYLTRLGDRMPGTTGQAAAESIFGAVPDDIRYAPTRRRYPAIAVRLPHVFATAPRRLRALAAETDWWWRQRVDGVHRLDREATVRLFTEAAAHFERALTIQTIALLGVVQPLYEAIAQLCERTGVGDVTEVSAGYSGFAEVAVVNALWNAAHGRGDIERVVREHGFHGPLEGELSSRVWREDASMLERLLEEYRERENPAELERQRRAEREGLERRLLAATSPAARPAVRGLLALCRRRIPLRGVAKRSFLQAIDVARAAARRLGDHLVADGVLADREDVFYLTLEEITEGVPSDAADLVARRRERREQYEQLVIPPYWKGQPSYEEVKPESDTVLRGIGVSPGIVEGRARVLLRPDASDFRPDEILVAPTTDPSWSSIMFVSAGLVMDIGGALSHAAMVARELGVPCVVSTGNGTRAIRTGDLIRIDGRRGTVEVLSRAGEEPMGEPALTS